MLLMADCKTWLTALICRDYENEVTDT